MRTQRAPIRSRNLLTELHGAPTINEWETSYGDLIVYENDTIEAPGQISFRVLKRLGLGAYGHVYEVEEVTDGNDDGQHYAIKISKSANIHRNVASQEANILNTVCFIPGFLTSGFYLLTHR